MRTLALVALLMTATSASAQRAADVPGRPAPVALSDVPGTLSLGNLFNAETLDFSQSLEASYGGGAGGSVGLGIYTASLRWQPSSRLAGRVDVGVARNLGASGLYAGDGSNDPQVFLRNAELAYRPTDNSVIHFRVAQSPYGSYASPYGSRSGYGAYGRSTFGPPARSSGDLFFRDNH